MPSEITAHTAAEIVQKLLINGGLGVAPPASGSASDWSVYINSEPDKPDAVITVYDTTGVIGGRLGPTGDKEEMFGVMIRIRGGSPTAGGVKARAIARYLDSQVNEANVTIGSYTYLVHSVDRSGTVNPLGPTQQGGMRRAWSINVLTSITQTAPA